MNRKILICGVLIFNLTLCFPAGRGLQAQKKDKDQENQAVYIPKEVKEVFKTGIKTRQARPDIPFEVIEHIYLPARENVHSIIFFKVKNSDLGYTPVVPDSESKAKEQTKESTQEAAGTSGLLKTKSHVFLQFNQLDGDLEREVYIPLDFQAEEGSFDPEEEVICSTGYPLPHGKFLLSMAIASWDLKKIGAQYFEFTLPNAAVFTDTLDTTPVFFVRELNRMENPEMKVEIHRDYFTYSVLQITPNLEKTFKPGENLDIFFFLYGAQPNAEGAYDIDASYQVLQKDKPVIKFAGTKYNNPIISQPLPIKKTVIVQTQEGDQVTEKKETKDLDPGLYTLNIELKCNITGKTVSKTIDFVIE